MRYLFIEIILPLLLFALLRSVLKSIFGVASNSSSRASQPAPSSPVEVAGGELMRDPVCGTYVSAALSVKRAIKGETVHFCSSECRDKYRVA